MQLAPSAVPSPGIAPLLADGLFGIGIVLAGLHLFGWLHGQTGGVSSLRFRTLVPIVTRDNSAFGETLPQYLARIRKNERAFDPLVATRRVFQDTRHSDTRRIHPAENWVQWTLGCVYPPLARSQDADRLMAMGLANCSERAQILKTIAEAAGCECRFVGLQGHVVLELRYQGRWHVADPDYGVVFPHGIPHVARGDYQPTVREQLAAAGHGPQAIETYSRLLSSQADNTVLPIGSALSPRLHLVEQLCRRLTWILPLCFLGCGWLFLSRSQSHAVRLGNARRFTIC